MRKAAVSILVLIVPLLIAASSLRVFTDKSTYSPGETVTITIKGKPNTPYGLEIIDPGGGKIIVKEIDTGPDGTGIFRFTLPKEARLGKYTVYVSGGGETASTSFTVTAATAPALASQAPAPAPSMSAAAALHSARGRLQFLLYVLRSLNASLSLLRLEGVLAEVWAAVGNANLTLQRAEAAYAVEDYESTSSLASSVYQDAGQLISRAFDLTVSALRSYASKVRDATSDELVLSLLNVVEGLLTDVSSVHVLSPTYIDPSLRTVKYSAYILLASTKLVNATRFEAEAKELSGQLEALRKSLSEAQSKLQELERNLTALGSVNERLSVQLNEAQNALATARGEVERLRAESEQLKSRNAELERRVADLSSQVNVMLALVVLTAAAGFAAGYLLRAKKSK